MIVAITELEKGDKFSFLDKDGEPIPKDNQVSCIKMADKSKLRVTYFTLPFFNNNSKLYKIDKKVWRHNKICAR